MKQTYFVMTFFDLTYMGVSHLLYNKRACPQTMFKILRLRRQHCQINRITGLPKTWGQERERAENKNPERGGGDTCNARVGPTSNR
jgi:hypothetical protein